MPRPEHDEPAAGRIWQTPEEFAKSLGGVHAGTWTYQRVDGSTVLVVVRVDRQDGKTFRPLHPVSGGWVVGDPEGPLPLYGLPELVDAPRVFVCEGEKAVDAARQLGLIATTSAHGCKSAARSDWAPLAGKSVVILPDNDPAGREFADAVAALLHKLMPPANVRMINLPDLPPGGDIVDYREAKECHDDDDLRHGIEELADSAPVCTPAAAVDCDGLPPLTWQPFPVETIPEPVRSFIVEGATALGVDPSFVALPVLASCAAAIGTTRRILIKDSWSEPSILWTAIVAKSGQVKSPAIDLALGPIRQVQDEAFEQYAEAMKDHGDRFAEYEVDHGEWKNHGRKQGKDRPAQPEEPICERFVVQDTTIEALASVLETSPRGLLLGRDELAAWISGFDQYRRRGGADVANWLELHGGRTMTVDRKTGARRVIRVRNAAVSVTGSIQPRTLARALVPEFFENGYSARLLLTMPPKRRKHWSDVEVSPGAKKQYAAVIGRMLTLEHGMNAAGRPTPIEIPLGADGKREWVLFYEECAKRQAGTCDDDLLAAYAKLEGAAARFALIFHLIRWAAGDSAPTEPGSVGAADIRAGATLSRWFSNETERIYQVLRESGESQERRGLIEFIRNKGGEVTARELMRAGPCYKSAGDAQAALDQLQQSGCGEWISPHPGPSGGRPTKVFRLNDATEAR